MRYSLLLSSLAAVLGAFVTTASAKCTTLPPPKFTAIFTGQFTADGPHGSTQGPFGTRYHLQASGGSMLNATTKEIVANILSFTDDGLETSTGCWGSGVMPLIWSADGHFAWVSLTGHGSRSTGGSWDYVHVETDSPTYSSMNEKFLIMQTDGSHFPAMSFTIYVEAS